MEYIELTHSPLITNLAKRATWALDWLSRVSAPPEDVMGSDVIGPTGVVSFVIGSSRTMRRLWAFSSIDALERYMNKVRRCLIFRISAI